MGSTANLVTAHIAARHGRFAGLVDTAHTLALTAAQRAARRGRHLRHKSAASAVLSSCTAAQSEVKRLLLAEFDSLNKNAEVIENVLGNLGSAGLREAYPGR